MILPQALPTSVGWQTVDWTELQTRTQPAAGGLATIELDQLDGDERWALHHAVVACDSTTPTVMRLYRGAPSPFTLVDGSDRGNFDVADWPAPGLLLVPGSSPVVQWSGASTGSRGYLALQLSVMRRR